VDKIHHKEKLVIFSAHYDSARCLPPTPKKSIINLVVMWGLSLVPSIGMKIVTVILWVIFISNKIPGIIPGFPAGNLLPGLIEAMFLGLALIGIIVEIIELYESNKSANLPYNPGFNDNMSSVAALIGIMAALFIKKPE